jgi:hypothetical protein
MFSGEVNYDNMTEYSTVVAEFIGTAACLEYYRSALGTQLYSCYKLAELVPRHLVISKFEDFKKRHMFLHQVTEVHCRGGDTPSVRLMCNCPYFWKNSNTYGSHVVAIYHRKAVINVFDQMSSLRAV